MIGQGGENCNCARWVWVRYRGIESLYRALSPDDNPDFSTVLKGVRVLRLGLHAAAADARPQFINEVTAKSKGLTRMRWSQYLLPFFQRNNGLTSRDEKYFDQNCSLTALFYFRS